MCVNHFFPGSSPSPLRHPLVPPASQDAYSEWDWHIVSQHDPHTITFRITHPDGRVWYLKLATRSWFPSPTAEADRLRWAQPYLSVPRIVDAGTTETIEWLVTEAMTGEDATDPRLKVDPPGFVRLLARGLRAFHETPVSECPFRFELDVALAHVERRAKAGLIEPTRDFHPEHQFLTVSAAVDQLVRDRPVPEDLVVCHGDYCLPNVLIEGDQIVGFLDLGELGVADRWWDLAVATWSTEWNLGNGYEDVFLESYGVELDAKRCGYFRLLYDLVS